MATLSLVCDSTFTYQSLTKNSSKNTIKMTDTTVKINVERMKQALVSPTFEMPSGLTREQKRAFILLKRQFLATIY